jgi:hypothetical protein
MSALPPDVSCLRKLQKVKQLRRSSLSAAFACSSCRVESLILRETPHHPPGQHKAPAAVCHSSRRIATHSPLRSRTIHLSLQPRLAWWLSTIICSLSSLVSSFSPTLPAPWLWKLPKLGLTFGCDSQNPRSTISLSADERQIKDDPSPAVYGYHLRWPHHPSSAAKRHFSPFCKSHSL